ncbi:MAG: hypothetical protein LBC40_06865 [Dysgonamonadaceae bacterium]|jgi:hypothetical protein|nr:hypothetical protein [Dysgonamonadaceae bacterium]
MVTYQLEIDETLPIGKSILSLLKSAKEAVSLKKVKTKEETHSPLYYELDQAFKDVKLMMEGKKKEKTLDELIYELQNSND